MRIVMAGGGVIALLTAVRCVSAGHEVVLVDQSDIPFTGATSFDRHRVLRALHGGDPGATAAAVRAHYQWIKLQNLLATPFYEQVGALTVLPGHDLARARDLLNAAGSPARTLGPDALAAEYPPIRFPAGASAVHEKHAGVLLADRVLAACAGWLRWHPGAHLHPNRRVVSVDTDRASVRLADGEELTADAVLLAIGPWSRDLLPADLAADLLLYRQSMVYCEVPDAAAWSGVPAVTSLGTPGGAWLVPPVAGSPLKLSAASACRRVAEVEDNATPPRWREHLLAAFTDLVPGLRADWLIDTRDCYYLARASTGGPMLAELGERVLSYAACGGSSFKFAPLIACALAQRLTGRAPRPTGIDALDGGVVRVAEPSLTRGVS